jgi:hypothetical protein
MHSCHLHYAVSSRASPCARVIHLWTPSPSGRRSGRDRISQTGQRRTCRPSDPVTLRTCSWLSSSHARRPLDRCSPARSFAQRCAKSMHSERRVGDGVDRHRTGAVRKRRQSATALETTQRERHSAPADGHMATRERETRAVGRWVDAAASFIVATLGSNRARASRRGHTEHRKTPERHASELRCPRKPSGN